MSTFIEEQAEAEQRADDVINEINPLSNKDELAGNEELSLQEIRGALQDIEDLDGFLIPYNLLDEHRELNSLIHLSRLLAELSDPSCNIQPGEDVEKESLLKNLIGEQMVVSSARPEFTSEGVSLDGICRLESLVTVESVSPEKIRLSGEFYVEDGHLTNMLSPREGSTSVRGIRLFLRSATILIPSMREGDNTEVELSQAA